MPTSYSYLAQRACLLLPRAQRLVWLAAYSCLRPCYLARRARLLLRRALAISNANLVWPIAAAHDLAPVPAIASAPCDPSSRRHAAGTYAGTYAGT